MGLFDTVKLKANALAADAERAGKVTAAQARTDPTSIRWSSAGDSASAVCGGARSAARRCGPENTTKRASLRGQTRLCYLRASPPCRTVGHDRHLRCAQLGRS